MLHGGGSPAWPRIVHLMEYPTFHNTEFSSHVPKLNESLSGLDGVIEWMDFPKTGVQQLNCQGFLNNMLLAT